MTLTRCVRPPDRGSDDHDNAAVSDDTDTYARTHPQSSMGCWALHGLYIRMYLLITFYRMPILIHQSMQINSLLLVCKFVCFKIIFSLALIYKEVWIEEVKSYCLLLFHKTEPPLTSMRPSFETKQCQCNGWPLLRDMTWPALLLSFSTIPDSIKHFQSIQYFIVILASSCRQRMSCL